MKQHIIILFVFFSLAITEVDAQNTELLGDSIELTIDGYKAGNIQWQISTDSVIWNDIAGAKNITFKNIVFDDSYFRCKITVGNCVFYSTTKYYNLLPEKKIYGVKIDRKKISENSIERIFNSVGKNTFSEIEGNSTKTKDDFMQIYPFNKMRICNIIKSDTVIPIIIYENEIGFTRNQDTFVEIPLFYMKRYINGNYDIRLISQTKYEGFYPAPMFIESEKILDKVYVAVYETSIDSNGIVQTVTGKLPLTEKKITEFRELYKRKGIGYSAMDIRTIMSLEQLYLIRFANKNSQSIIGGGWTNLRQPSFKIFNNGPSNSLVIGELENSVDYYWFKNQKVCTVKKNDHDVDEYATLIEYKKNIPRKGYTTFIVDKTLNFDTTMYFGSSAQLTGWSDVLLHDTGRTKQNTSNKDIQNNSVKLFGIENLWGNVWEMVDGIFFKGLTPYIGFDIQKYGQESSYEAVNFKCLEQFSNDAGNFGYISNLGIDSKYSWFSFPDLLGGNGVDGTNGYGDYYYQSNELIFNRYSVFGGGFDHFNRAGIFNFRNWNSSTNFWYLYGSRMQYKPLN